MTISHLLLTRIRLSMSAISLALFVVAITLISFKGLNWGLDFTGGVVAEVRLDQHLNSTELSSLLSQALQQDVQIINGTEPGIWTFRYNQVGDQAQTLVSILSTTSDDVDVLNSSIVGPQVGQDMLEQGGLAILACFALTMIYLSYRFEWRLALGALTALVHDIVIVLGFFSMAQLEFNLTILAAVLAVLGYSLNDSIIIADRTRELFKAKTKGNSNELINDALRASLSRTLITSGTTLVTVSSLWLLGGPALEGFAIALCLGIASGTWSSISIGVSLPHWIGLDPKHYQLNTPSPEEDLP